MDKKVRSNRIKVQCLLCGSEFVKEYKSTHEKKLHGGKCVSIKIVGVPENPFVLAAKKKEKMKNLIKVFGTRPVRLPC